MSFIKSFAYECLDLLTLRKGIKRSINGWKIKFPVRYYKYFPSSYEVENFNFLEKHFQKGKTALDIGAHIGLYSVIMGQLAAESGRVFAFEPTPATRKLLHETLALNKVGEIVKVQAEALSKETGKATFYVSDYVGDNSNSLVNHRRDRNVYPVDVSVTTVDAFREENKLNIGFMKIDVEGAELDLLKGAERTFNTDRPKVILSLHPKPIKELKGSLEEIWDLLLEYKMYVTFGEKQYTRGEFCKSKEFFDVHLIPIS